MLKKDLFRKKIKYLIIFFLFLFFSNSALAVEADLNSNYIIKADEINFIRKDGVITFEGNPSLHSEDFVVKADRMRVNTESKEVKAVGNVEINSEKSNFYGERLDYNYQNENGELYGVEGNMGDLNISGKTFKLYSLSPLEGEIPAAEYTPCIREDPHYHYKTKNVKINDDNTVDLYHNTLYIWKIPVFYLPYYSVTYNPDEDELKNTYPVPVVGYDSDRGVTVELDYPYKINDKNSGKISYLTEGTDYDRYEIRNFSNNHRLTETLTFKNRYHYLYDYDLDDEELDDEEEEFFSSIEYNKGKYALEAGLGRDLMAEKNKNRYFYSARYRFNNGLNTRFRHEYNFDWERVKESYIMSYNQEAIKWNLKYIDGEDYNYFPYLTLTFPKILGWRSSLGTGRVENGGRTLNKERLLLSYSNSYPLNSKLSYHLGYRYRLDHYRSSYDYNYHYTTLNTGFRYKSQLKQDITLNSSLFFEKNYPWGKSPLPDDREDQDRLLKPAVSLNIKRDLEQSAYKISSSAIYDFDLEDWDEINLRLTQSEDCFSFYLNYEFIDDAISFGIEI